MTRVLKLRLKLDDFIDTDFESTIMNKIKKTEDELRIKIILYLWIDDTSDKTFLTLLHLIKTKFELFDFIS